MPTTTETIVIIPAEDKLTAAIKAVRHVLRRIAEDHKIAYLMGDCTESYDLLCRAVAVHDGCTVDQVEEWFPPCPKPGTPTRAEEASLKTVSDLCAQVCQALNIAPIIASKVIAFAERHDLRLRTWTPRSDDHEKLAFEAQAHAAFLGAYNLA